MSIRLVSAEMTLFVVVARIRKASLPTRLPSEFAISTLRTSRIQRRRHGAVNISRKTWSLLCGQEKLSLVQGMVLNSGEWLGEETSCLTANLERIHETSPPRL